MSKRLKKQRQFPRHSANASGATMSEAFPDFMLPNRKPPTDANLALDVRGRIPYGVRRLNLKVVTDNKIYRNTYIL